MACFLNKFLRRSKMEIDNLIHCMLCYHRTRKENRVTFPDCGHMFCTTCIQRHCDAQRRCKATTRCMEVTDLRQHAMIWCPTCGMEAEGSHLVRQRVPLNHKLYDLCDNIKVISERVSMSIKKCQTCEDQKRAPKPVFVCVTCTKWLCGRCWQRHQSGTSGAAQHIIIKASYFNTHLRYKCGKHNQPISHHCITCTQLVCHVCINETDKRTYKSHAEHQVETLSHIQAQHCQSLAEKQLHIHKLMQERVRQRTACEQLHQQSSIHYQRSKQSIEREMERLIRNIQETGRGLLAQIDNMHHSATTLHENHTSYLDYTISILSGFSFLLQELTQPGNEPIVLLHGNQIHEHLRQFSSDRVKAMEREAFVEIHKVPDFIPDIQYDEGKGMSLGGLQWVPQEDLLQVQPPLDMPMVDISIPGGEKKWESPTSYGSTTGFNTTQPFGLCFTETEPIRLLVAECKGREIAVYTDKGERIEKTIKVRNFFPRNIALNRAENLLYVTDDFQKVVKAFNTAGELVPLSSRRQEKFTEPSGIATNGDVIVVSDTFKHSITILRADGQLLRSFGREGTGINQFKTPDFLILDDENRIVVSDRNNHRVCVYTLDGKHVLTFGARGSDPGQFESPSGVCQDQLGNYLVVDCGNNRICRFTQDGQFDRTVIQFPHGSIKPFAIAISSEGDVAISDRATDKIVVYKLYNI